MGGGDEEEVSEANLIARMSPTERAAYEEKKLKMRKAMVSQLLAYHARAPPPLGPRTHTPTQHFLLSVFTM